MFQDFKSEIKLLLIVAAMSIVLGLGGILVLRATTSFAPPPQQIQTLNSEDWQTYRNEMYGFELSYPPDWSVSQQWDYQIQTPYIQLATGGYASELGATLALLKLYLDYPRYPEYFSEDVKEIRESTKDAIPYRIEKTGLLLGDLRIGIQKEFWPDDTHLGRIKKDFEDIISSIKTAEERWSFYESGFRIRYPSGWKNNTDENANNERRTAGLAESHVFSNKDTLAEVEKGESDLIGIELLALRNQDARDLFDALSANKARWGETVEWKDGSAYVIEQETHDFFPQTSVRVRAVSDASQIGTLGQSILLPHTSQAQRFVKSGSVVYIISPLGLPETVTRNQNLIDRVFSTFR